MTPQEKQKKAEQEAKRLRARVIALERGNEYLSGLCERMEASRHREVAEVKAIADLLRMILERVVLEVGEITIPSGGMGEEIEKYDMEYHADPKAQTIRIKAREKEQA